ncbi:MAG TPA: phosphoadenylyl-sulfate reductase [Thermoleophilaceae bacterium]|nr:phosphoadenylyl-sulfate reductase [Thermoleophilaceae bacterium]
MTLAPDSAPTDVEDLSAEGVLEYAVERFGRSLYVACSFQKESSVIMHMLLEIDPEARFFTLDTGLLFPETYATWDGLERRFGVEIDVFQGPTVARQAALYGDELWKRDPEACCGLRKVAPLEQALADVDAWVSGLRREQSPGRSRAPKLTWDDRRRVYKVHPLADWSERDVWRYVHRHDLPYNPLHDRGYGSIGCTHCTKPGNGREGRWAGSERDECGLH